MEIILEIRDQGEEGAQVGDNSLRPRQNPYTSGELLNQEADCLADLISWKMRVYEPPLTCCLTNQQLKELVGTPMEVPKWPSHTQGVERVIKMVTEASLNYFSHGKRDGAVRLQQASRRICGVESKQDLAKMVMFGK